EETVDTPQSQQQKRRQVLLGESSLHQGSHMPIVLPEVKPLVQPRIPVGYREMDRVLGGGLVPGSMVLIGGEPGIGKSTLLLQLAAKLEAGGHPALYVSGEESPYQVRMRADRLGNGADAVMVAAETNLESIIATAAATPPAALIV